MVTTGPLGGRGDALAQSAGERLYVPYALPGERLEVRPGAPRGDGRDARIQRILEPSPERVVPPCPHFGTCGGCAVQHMAPDSVAAWKHTVVVEALARRGFAEPPVQAVRSVPPGTRRRATFAYRRTGGRLVLGFNQRARHRIVDLTDCPVLRPEIVALLPPLRDALGPVLPNGATGDLFVQWSDTGTDVRLDLPATPGLEARERLARVAEELDLARLTVRVDALDEPIAVRRPPIIHLGDVPVALPVGAFLQPSAEGECILRDLVQDSLTDVPGPVADLFCGLGTFALPLAATRTVTAVDGDPRLVGALGATGRVRTMTRDLFRQPVLERELKGIAAVVLDPPRAGARAQVEALTKMAPATGPTRIVAVSCNPATFARDARILVNGGFALTRVIPVDQFAWSAHVELVAVFDRPYSCGA